MAANTRYSVTRQGGIVPMFIVYDHHARIVRGIYRGWRGRRRAFAAIARVEQRV